MADQHRELYLRLEDVEKLQLYAQSAASKHHALEDDLGKAKVRSKHWEKKAKASARKITSTEKERGEAKEESQHARLVIRATVG